jgi:hypothetical protein
MRDNRSTARAVLKVLRVNWMIDTARWTWLTLTFLAFIAIECVAIYYLYKLLGWF